MSLEILLAAALALLGFGEFYVWYSEVLWQERVKVRST